jgi:hypothetical protein
MKITRHFKIFLVTFFYFLSLAIIIPLFFVSLKYLSNLGDAIFYFFLLIILFPLSPIIMLIPVYLLLTPILFAHTFLINSLVVFLFIATILYYILTVTAFKLFLSRKTISRNIFIKKITIYLSIDLILYIFLITYLLIEFLKATNV